MALDVKASTIQAYPGGYERWHADMTREANRQSLKSAMRGTKICQDRQSITDSQKNAAGGSTGRNSHMPGVPNQTEQRYRDEFLIPRILSGEIAECVFEGVTLILSRAERCTYTPDFWVTLADGGYEAHEVKGAQVWEDSRIKVKWAATAFPGVWFVWGQWKNGKWKVREVKSDVGCHEF